MSKRTALLIVLVLAISLVAALYFSKNTIFQKISQPAVEQEKKAWEQKTQKLEKEISTLKDEIQKQEPTVPQEKLRGIFGEKPAIAPLQKEVPCTEYQTQVFNFFSHLDQKGYLKAQGFGESAYDHFIRVAAMLEKNRPIISGETQDLYVLMRNIAYFYRVLGGKNIKLITSIASSEAEIMEPAMQLLYTWINPWDRCSEKEGIRLSPEALYDYAGFFLNTIAGHSYLARRDLKMRTLIVYYCVLIINSANQQNLNKYGIDIRPHIDLALDDIASQKGLLYQKEYLQTLDEMRKKYGKSITAR